MHLVILDHDGRLKQEDIQRMSSVGIKTILTFDIVDSFYDFERNIERWQEYVGWCNDVGIEVWLQSAVGFMSIPDEFCLHNVDQEPSNFHRAIPNTEFEKLALANNRKPSYWSSTANEWLKNYIRTLQSKVSCKVLPAIGCSAGEFFFPITHYWPILKQQNYKIGPWWYDRNAENAFKQGKAEGYADHKEWWKVERIRIVEEQLSWYDHRFLSFTDLFWGDLGWAVGTFGMYQEMCRFKPYTYLFYSGYDADSISREVGQARVTHFSALAPTYVGVCGAKNLMSNSIRAKAAGAVGCLCGPQFAMYDDSLLNLYDKMDEYNKYWEQH